MNILHFSPYPTYPPDIGGKVRIYHLNKYLSKTNTIFQFSCNLWKRNNKIPLKSWLTTINKRYVEFCYSPPLLMIYSFLFHRFKLYPLAHISRLLNVVAPRWIIRKMRETDILVMEHPWLFDWIYKNNKEKKPLVLSARNIEYHFVKDVFKDVTTSPLRKRIVDTVYGLEKRCLENVDLVLCIGDRDVALFNRVYGIPRGKMKVITSCMDTTAVTVSTDVERERLKKQEGFSGKKIVLFVGGHYEPNYDAVRFIQRIALRVKDDDVLFLVAGTVGQEFTDKGNIQFRPNPDVKKYFRMADMAINPQTFKGITSNVKMGEFLGYGLPTIATRSGARSYAVTNKKDVLIEETAEGFADSIMRLARSKASRKKLGVNARRLVEKHYSYAAVAKRIEGYYKKLV